jgi:hypothetical protein
MTAQLFQDQASFPGSWGGGPKVFGAGHVTGPAQPSARDFFSRTQFLGGPSGTNKQVVPIFAGRDRPLRGSDDELFSYNTVEQEVSKLRIERENCREIQGWGGRLGSGEQLR